MAFHFVLNRLSIWFFIVCAIRKFSSRIACFFFAFRPRISSRRRFSQLDINSSSLSTTFNNKRRASSACEVVIGLRERSQGCRSTCELSCSFVCAVKLLFFVDKSLFVGWYVCFVVEYGCEWRCAFGSCVRSCSLDVFGACPHLVTGCRSTQCASQHFAPLRQSLRRDSGCTNMQPNLMQEAPCRQGVWGRGQRIALRGMSSG